MAVFGRALSYGYYLYFYLVTITSFKECLCNECSTNGKGNNEIYLCSNQTVSGGNIKITVNISYQVNQTGQFTCDCIVGSKSIETSPIVVQLNYSKNPLFNERTSIGGIPLLETTGRVQVNQTPGVILSYHQSNNLSLRNDPCVRLISVDDYTIQVQCTGVRNESLKTTAVPDKVLPSTEVSEKVLATTEFSDKVVETTVTNIMATITTQDIILIAGCSAAGFVVLTAVIIIICCCCRRRRRKTRMARQQTVSHEASQKEEESKIYITENAMYVSADAFDDDDDDEADDETKRMSNPYDEVS